VAAANVSLFLLTRAPGRQRELGIRMSVGATLGRVARQVASEAAALVILAAMLGLVFSIWLGEFLLTLSFLRDAQWNDVRLLDWRVMGLVGAFILVISTIISLAPIVGLVRGGIAASSRQISASPSFSQSVAGATQIAIACTLGAAAFAYSWYLGALFFGDPGYVTRDLYAISYAIPLRVEEGAIVGMSATDKARRREIIVSLPGVSDVSFSSMVPGMQVVGGQFEARHPDNPSRRLLVRRAIIDANYVGMLQLDLLYGRSPTKTDVGVALVNQTLAHELWGRVNVVGETFPALNSNSADVPIIGVLADLSYGHPDATVEPMAFTTDGIQSIRDIAIISSSLSLAELQQGLQGLIDTGALELSIVESTSLNALRGDLIASDRARSALTAGASILVVSLAGVGFYGTQRYLVTLGRREYAIRAALGAGPRALGRLVLWRGCMLGIPGLVFGLPLAFFVVAWLHDNHLSRVISPFLMTLAAASSLAVLMMFASWGPARQARITQPAPLLKEI
jgi:ABC-type antimicrobial peptide transport system permease subunit